MILAIPLGYFVAIFLLISGILCGIEYIDQPHIDMTRAQLLYGLVVTAWPAALGVIILLLIQLNRQLENLRLVASYSPTPEKEKTAKKAQPRKEAPATPAKAATPAPAPPTPAAAPNLATLAGKAPQAAPTPPQPAAPHVPIYPNSPIPGGGRVPQPQTSAKPPVQQPPHPAPARRAPTRQESENLNYFKVD